MHNRESAAILTVTIKRPRGHGRKVGPAEENELELTTRDEACI
jgi:hypothetical protein